MIIKVLVSFSFSGFFFILQTSWAPTDPLSSICGGSGMLESRLCVMKRLLDHVWLKSCDGSRNGPDCENEQSSVRCVSGTRCSVCFVWWGTLRGSLILFLLIFIQFFVTGDLFDTDSFCAELIWIRLFLYHPWHQHAFVFTWYLTLKSTCVMKSSK